MFKKISDYVWECSVTNKRLTSHGWDRYRIVNTGSGFSLSLVKTVGSITETENIGSKIGSLQQAMYAAYDYDLNDKMPKWFRVSLFIVLASLTVFTFYMIFSSPT